MMKSRAFRHLFLMLVATCVYAGLTLAPSGLVAAAVTCGNSGSPWETVVVGVPRGGAGLVDVHDRNGGPQRVIRPGSLGHAGAVGDRFGAAVVSADINGDRCVDLVVGAPGTGGVGAVYLIYGTPAGVGLGSVIRLPYAGSAGDAFGAALAVEILPRVPALVYIWVGAPSRDVGGSVDAGAVVRYTLTAGAVSSPSVLTQNSPGVPGTAEAGDGFGQVLAPVEGGVLVGQPREDVGAKVDAGMVTMLRAPSGSSSRSTAVTEDSPGIAGAAESGDRFGAALSGGDGVLAVVGVPGEDLGTIRDTGMVHAIPLTLAPISDIWYISQNSAGVPGTAEAGDRFGTSVQHGVVNPVGNTPTCSAAEIAIGAPGEDIGIVANAGAITMYMTHRRPGSHCPSRVYQRGLSARPGDGLGAALGVLSDLGLLSGDLRGVSVEQPSRLVVGSPGEAVGSVPDAGVVEVLNPLGVFPNVESSFTLSTGSRAGTRYGSFISKPASCAFCYEVQSSDPPP